MSETAHSQHEIREHRESTQATGSGLFAPIRLGALALDNRIVMAPLTRNRAGPGQVPHELNAAYYAQRASAGLIITEATQISPQGVGYPNTPGIHSEAQVEGWRRVTEAVHAKGGHIVLQLWHVGRISHPSLQPDGALPVAPSAIKPDGEVFTYEGPQPFVTPRALEIDEIPGIVTDYRSAAANAREAGFDGVEVHAANGYLLDQFLRDGSNRRTDSYGGSLENRARLLFEVIDAATEVWEPGRVGLRLSPVNSFNSISDSDPDRTFGAVVERLNRYGLAYLHVVETDMIGAAANQGYDRAALRRAFKGPYMANGSYDLARAEATVTEDGADLVAFGQLYIANPDLAERFAQDAALNDPDPTTFYGGDARGYTDYPVLGGATVAA